MRFPEFSSVLKLRYHQYHPQYSCLQFSPSSSSCPYSCSCSYPVPVLCSNIAFLCFPCCILNHIPIFPVPNDYSQHPQVQNLIGMEHSLNRGECRVKNKAS